KTMIFEADGKPVVIVVRGDHDVNEIKVKRMLGAKSLELASPETIMRVTGAPVGFAGPVGLKEDVPVYADIAVKYVVNAVTGANAAGEEAHITGVNPGRDFEPTQYADVRNAVAGDSCPNCANGKFIIKRGMEVGHVFKLGTKYSEALGAKFLDADGQALKTIIMGCYGIGVARILAGCIENSYDEKGIIWPVSIAPYEVCIVPMRVNDEATMAAANKLYADLQAAGIDVLIDDRDARPGVKFNDIDLIGFPLRVVIGPKGLANNEVELKWRWESDCQNVALDSAAQTIADAISAERVSGERFKASKNA
ncbi:MAG: hypothetical protein IJF17_11890, partial [Thermoguttaceae bacterium]|nr:hypothetical protein [Thermoguttaceae bacterium]